MSGQLKRVRDTFASSDEIGKGKELLAGVFVERGIGKSKLSIYIDSGIPVPALEELQKQLNSAFTQTIEILVNEGLGKLESVSVNGEGEINGTTNGSDRQ